MNFYEYIGVTKETFERDYLDTRLVNAGHHDKFPLDIYTYGRETVHEDVWDNVTRKCRGIVVNRETGEIVARPFEKFFNFGQSEMPECQAESIENMPQPFVWEKVDGFLCTMYRWEGLPYIASKGSFTSPHAKWATAWYRANVKDEWPTGYTPVFEGITPNLRIVVDYGKEEKLVLLGVINIETGAEIAPLGLRSLAAKNGIKTPKLYQINWQEAHSRSYDETIKNDEGFVLTWYTKFPAEGVPFRLKLKHAEYLRLHRMVTGMSPKRILEVIENGWTSEMDEMLKSSTPWFAHFVTKWKTRIESTFNELRGDAERSYNYTAAKMHEKYKASGQFPSRKEWAYEFTQFPELAPMLFAKLDGKNIEPIIWKKIKNASFLKGAGPMVDAHNL